MYSAGKLAQKNEFHVTVYEQVTSFDIAFLLF